METLALSVVVPCYNEESGLRELYRRVTAACRACVGESYELVMVNDGSLDETWNTMRELASADARVVAVNLSRNHGHQLAVTAGLQVSRGARVLLLDADLQDPPELLSQMMKQMDGGSDVVFGQRSRRAGETAFKKASAYLFYRLINRVSAVDIPRDTGDFRLMSRRVVDILNRMPEHYRFIRGMVSWVGFRQEPLVYDRAERLAGTTKYPLMKMISFAVDAVTGFSVSPLRIASGLGVLTGIASLGLLSYVLVRYFQGHTLEGWTSLAVIMLTATSVQLFVMGVMGEYVGRLYMESKLRPLFVIRDIVCSGPRAEVSPETRHLGILPGPTEETRGTQGSC